MRVTNRIKMDDTRKRVKLYILNSERQWEDSGTGRISTPYNKQLKGISMTVLSETDGSLLLQVKIQPHIAYQKQQDTLIVWSEEKNYDFALSFQDKIGCNEIWETICQIQGKDPSVDVTQDVVEDSEDDKFEDLLPDTTPPVELPSCELSRLKDIADLIRSYTSSPIAKEKLANKLSEEKYIKKLLNLFHLCEDLEDKEGLYLICDIFKNIFVLNKNSLFAEMFEEDVIFDVVGCLEYDPAHSSPKQHRKHLKDMTRYKEVIPINNPSLLAKIHATYRAQYIQDVVLPIPPITETNMFSMLSNIIMYNKVDIVTALLDDESYLREIFSLLKSKETSVEKKRDMVLFIKELASFSQNLQQVGKEAFCEKLASMGMLESLELNLDTKDLKTKSAITDILTSFVEFAPSVIREHILQQIRKTNREILLTVAIQQIIYDTDPELGSGTQVVCILKSLLDPENMLLGGNKSEKYDFLNYFYARSIHALITPLSALTNCNSTFKSDYCTQQRLGLIVEFLSFCVENHTHHIQKFILDNDLVKKVLVLMKSEYTFVSLCALRFMRKIISHQDETYNKHLMKGKHFSPILEAFERNKRENLLQSAILEMFEFIRSEGSLILCIHIVDNYSEIIERNDHVRTFKSLKTRCDMYRGRINDSEKESAAEEEAPKNKTTRYRRDERDLDKEEEIWFNEDEDTPSISESEEVSVVDSLTSPQLESLLGVCEKQKILTSDPTPVSNCKTVPTLNLCSVVAKIGAPNSSSERLISFRKALVDYEGDSDDDDDEDDLRSPPCKRQKML